MSTIAAALGALLVVAGILTAVVGGVFAIFIPQLVFGGILLLVGLAIERWRYKPIASGQPEPGWTDTGERFVDPETSSLTAVYLDVASGERHYVAIDRATRG